MLCLSETTHAHCRRAPQYTTKRVASPCLGFAARCSSVSGSARRAGQNGLPGERAQTMAAASSAARLRLTALVAAGFVSFSAFTAGVAARRLLGAMAVLTRLVTWRKGRARFRIWGLQAALLIHVLAERCSCAILHAMHGPAGSRVTHTVGR